MLRVALKSKLRIFIYVIWQAMPAIQTYTYKIRSYHTDASGRLFVHQLLNFLQDAAHNHADGFGFGQKQLVDKDLFWVLSRLTIEISSLPKHGEEIQLSTWVKSIRGAISEREFSISLAGQVLVNAYSLWFCVSGQSHKPARLPAEYSDLMEIKNSYATTGGTEKVEEANGENKRSEGMQRTAQYSDIDMVDHVNNATYLRWLMDEIPAEYQQNNKIKNISVNYIGESFLGNDVQVFHTILNPTNLLHEVVDTKSGKVICRTNSGWELE